MREETEADRHQVEQANQQQSPCHDVAWTEDPGHRTTREEGSRQHRCQQQVYPSLWEERRCCEQ